MRVVKKRKQNGPVRWWERDRDSRQLRLQFEANDHSTFWGNQQLTSSLTLNPEDFRRYIMGDWLQPLERVAPPPAMLSRTRTRLQQAADRLRDRGQPVSASGGGAIDLEQMRRAMEQTQIHPRPRSDAAHATAVERAMRRLQEETARFRVPLSHGIDW